jgi:hypothetical protein
MQVDRENFIKDLKTNVIEVTFNKVNGTQRVMRCTLREDLLPDKYSSTEQEKFHKDNNEVIACWDVVNGGWRSFRTDSVVYIQDVNDNY